MKTLEERMRPGTWNETSYRTGWTWRGHSGLNHVWLEYRSDTDDWWVAVWTGGRAGRWSEPTPAPAELSLDALKRYAITLWRLESGHTK